jgi:molybdopterin converting factor subunit 1
MAKVTVRLFARLAEMAGTRAMEVELGEGLTAGDVFALVTREHPGVGEMRVAFAVNRKYADADQPLREGDEVALIPPVSGGGDAL